jgi:HTH-type transcriptional regulator / antitoxin HipB
MSTLQTFPLQTSAQLSVHLKSLRKARGLTQTALGERIGVKQVRMADIEKNPGAVSLDQLIQVLHALDSRLLLADLRRYADAGATPAPAVNSPATDW